MAGKYDDHNEDHQLYIITAESCVLYIGISSQNIWHRWFNSPRSHLRQNYSLKGKDPSWGYSSDIGEAVVRCFPESLNWVIELWTMDDCLKSLNDSDNMGRTPKRILDIERVMINKLRPAFNLMGANYQTDLDKLPDAIKKYKGLTS